MIIYQRIIGVIALVISLVLITLDHYYSKKITQKYFEIKGTDPDYVLYISQNVDLDYEVTSEYILTLTAHLIAQEP